MCIRDSPKADGFCVETLLEFFKVAMRLKRCFPVSEAGFLALLMPYCNGALGDRLAKHLAADNFDGFHQEALEFFIPDRLFSSLKQKLFLRAQARGEPLSTYISEIKEAAQVLRLPVTEREVVDNIVSGLSAQTRSCLVFCNRPSTFADLDKICVEVANFQFTDQTTANRGPANPPANAGLREDRRLYYHCKEEGHVRRYCPRMKPANPKKCVLRDSMVSNCFSISSHKSGLPSRRRVPVKTPFTPTCYLCGKKGHYIWRCRSFVGKASKKNPRKRSHTTNGRESRMLTQRVTSHDLYKEHLGAGKNLTSLFKNKRFSPRWK